MAKNGDVTTEGNARRGRVFVVQYYYYDRGKRPVAHSGRCIPPRVKEKPPCSLRLQNEASQCRGVSDFKKTTSGLNLALAAAPYCQLWFGCVESTKATAERCCTERTDAALLVSAVDI